MDVHSLHLFVAWPEMVLLGFACFILLADLWLPRQGSFSTARLSAVGLVLFSVLMLLGVQYGEAFRGMYIADELSMLTKLALSLGMLAVFVYAQAYLQRYRLYQGEFYTLSLFALLGMMVMISARHFLVMYMGLELFSLALYALIALHRDSSRASESAMKYFILGALSSGFLLYGISLVYGATGSLALGLLNVVDIGISENPVLLALGLVFILVAIAFKLNIVPFHMWAPDVYQGASYPVLMIVGALSKVAIFVMMVRIFVESRYAWGLLQETPQWTWILFFLAIASMVVGNLMAIVQNSLKRMLAFSSIAHMGFVVLGAAVLSHVGLGAALFYVLTYALTAVLGFAALSVSNVDSLEDIKGLSSRCPLLALVLLVVMCSLAGLPPFVGFYAKFVTIRALLLGGEGLGVLNQGAWPVVVAVVAVLMSLIGAFYYLRVVKYMYFDQVPEQTNHASGERLQAKFGGSLFTSLFAVHVLILLGLGILPGVLLDGSTVAFVPFVLRT